MHWGNLKISTLHSWSRSIDSRWYSLHLVIFSQCVRQNSQVSSISSQVLLLPVFLGIHFNMDGHFSYYKKMNIPCIPSDMQFFVFSFFELGTTNMWNCKRNRILIFDHNKNLWAPQTWAYATLRQSVANLMFRNVSFNFARYRYLEIWHLLFVPHRTYTNRKGDKLSPFLHYRN